MPNSSSTHHSGFLTPTKKRAAAFIAAVALALMLVLTQPPHREAYAVSDRLPDLRMARVQDVVVGRTSDGRRLLRFTSIPVNVGSGPFELRGHRSTKRSTMKVNQRIYDNAGGHRDVRTKAAMKWSGDGHAHWHVTKLQSFVLERLRDGRKVATSPKKLHCLHDDYRYGSTRPAYYTYGNGACGPGRPKALEVPMGLSVGWGDDFRRYLPYMYINIKGLAPGDYRLVATVDPPNRYIEEKNTNNSTWVDLRLEEGGVQILRYGPAARPSG